MTVEEIQAARKWLLSTVHASRHRKVLLAALDACKALLPYMEGLGRKVRAVDAAGGNPGSDYLLGQVDILRIVRSALGIPRPADEPKLYVECNR